MIEKLDLEKEMLTAFEDVFNGKKNQYEIIGERFGNVYKKLNELIDAVNEQEKKIDFIMENTNVTYELDSSEKGWSKHTLKDQYEK